MNEACNSCAFGPIGGAADEPLNTFTAQICSFGALPFYCHHGRDGVEYEWRNSPLGPLLLERSNRKVCAGWRSQVAELNAAGYFKTSATRLIRRLVARRGLAMFHRFLDEENLHRKEKARVQMEKCMLYVITKNNETMGIPL